MHGACSAQLQARGSRVECTEPPAPSRADSMELLQHQPLDLVVVRKKMAVKKRKLVAENRSQIDLATLAAYIQSMNEQHNYLPPQHEMVRQAEDIVRCLARTFIGVEDERTWMQLQTVEEFLLRMVTSVHDELRKEIVAAVLDKFYSIISDPQCDASPVTSIVLIVFVGGGEQSMRLAARWLVAQREAGPGGPRCAGLRASLSCLYRWAAQWRGTPALGDWTMAFVKELEELEQFDILVEVSTYNVACLLLALDSPADLKESVADVIFHVMASLRESMDAFDRMAPHVSQVLENLASDSGQWSRQLLQNVVDILTATVDTLVELEGTPKANNDFKEKYSSVISCLERHMASRGCRFLSGPTWKARNGACAPAATDEAPPTRKVGLLNLGNTCYMNSVIQALLVTRKFSSHVMLRMENVPYWSKIGALFAKMTHSISSKLSPDELFQIIKPPFFSLEHQHDSSEFLGYLFEMLHTHEDQSEREFDYSRPPTNQGRIRSITCQSSTDTEGGSGSSSAGAAAARPGTSNRRSASPRPSGSGASSSSATKRPAETDLARIPKKRVRFNEPSFVPHDSYIDNLFGGVLLTRIECNECHISSLSRDVFRDLQLAFPEKPERQLSVQALLEYFCSKERLCGDNKYQCPECRGLKEAERSVIIESPPKYLILVLKYFRFESKLQVQNKLMMAMHYNHSITLPKVRAHAEQTLYHLYAAVIHSGSTLDSGHYYTLAKDGDQWFQCNDEIVRLSDISELSVLTKCCTPYILFYRRSDIEETTAPVFHDLPPKIQQAVLSHNKQVVETVRRLRSSTRP